MKGLRTYLNFDLGAFLDGKNMIIASVKPVKTDNFNGISIEALITADPKDDEKNIYQKFTVKVRNGESLLNQIHVGQNFSITKYEKASVYGEYQDKLSVIGTIEIYDA